MKSINQYITEKFKINKYNIEHQPGIDADIPDSFLDKPFPDELKKRMTKDKKELLWWKFWRHLAINGPMKKEDLLKDFDLKVTSYTTLFTQLSKEKIILPVKELRTWSNGSLTIKKGGFLIAQPVSKWNL